MPFADYQDLQDTVARYLKRNNLVDDIPDFISLAEMRLNRALRVRQMRTRYVVTPGNNYVTLPGDYQEAIRLMYGANRLVFISEDMAEMNMEQGQYYQYTIAGDKLWLLTQIDSTTKLHVHYYQQIPALSSINQTNWLLEDGPDVYLYAALVEAEAFLKNDARIDTWKAALAQAISDVSSNDDAGQYCGASLMIKSA